MQRFLKNITWIMLVLTISSCAVSIAYKYDYGQRNGSNRYLDIEEKQFTVSVSVCSDRSCVILSGLSKHNAPAWIEDTISEVNFIEKELSFPDGTILEKKSRPLGISAHCYDKDGKEIPCLTYYYTCDDFKKKLRKYKHLNLKLGYNLDSLGVMTQHKKKYELVKKKYYRFAVH